MNNEIEKTRELKFKCPECGSNKLRASAAGWLEIDHVYDNGVFSWSDLTIKQFEDVQCSDCGYDIGQDEEEGWIEWLNSHCKQDESHAGKAQEDNSGVPPDNES
jgi:ribosomal protein L37AE/L43A